MDVPKVRHYLNCYRRFHSVSYSAKTYYRNFTADVSPEWALLWDQFVCSYWENRLGEPCLLTGPHSGNSSMSLGSSFLHGIKVQHRILNSMGKENIWIYYTVSGQNSLPMKATNSLQICHVDIIWLVGIVSMCHALQLCKPA